MNYTSKVSSFLADLADVFSGNYHHKSSELDEWREELFDISVTPTIRDDKKALKGDFNTFLKDTQKAHNSLKKEFLYGETE
ncbi:MAG: hypothetical protein GDA42_00160 [Ekhidna sp.]|nr:hypothetical protein [Ekhidna sp.]